MENLKHSVKTQVVNRGQAWEDQFFLPAIFQGLRVTVRHFFANWLFKKRTVTILYPEVKRPVAKRWRGRHRLTRHQNGFIKCVACYLCETVCPAHCIHIEAAETPMDKSIEKYPRVFDIDELRCVFCGLCVEACPKDAIRMDTEIISLTATSRAEFDYTRDLLMDELPKTARTKYHEVPTPSDELAALPRSKGVVAD